MKTLVNLINVEPVIYQKVTIKDKPIVHDNWPVLFQKVLAKLKRDGKNEQSAEVYRLYKNFIDNKKSLKASIKDYNASEGHLFFKAKKLLSEYVDFYILAQKKIEKRKRR